MGRPNSVMKGEDEPVLTVLEGGRKDPPKSDWLSSLPVGTSFLCMRKGGYFLDQYQVYRKSDLAVKLWDTDDDRFLWVIPERFCQDNLLFEILFEVKEKDE